MDGYLHKHTAVHHPFASCLDPASWLLAACHTTAERAATEQAGVAFAPGLLGSFATFIRAALESSESASAGLPSAQTALIASTAFLLVAFVACPLAAAPPLMVAPSAAFQAGTARREWPLVELLQAGLQLLQAAQQEFVVQRESD